jgi:hypothetical protein
LVADQPLPLQEPATDWDVDPDGPEPLPDDIDPDDPCALDPHACRGAYDGWGGGPYDGGFYGGGVDDYDQYDDGYYDGPYADYDFSESAY